MKQLHLRCADYTKALIGSKGSKWVIMGHPSRGRLCEYQQVSASSRFSNLESTYSYGYCKSQYNSININNVNIIGFIIIVRFLSVTACGLN